MRRRGRRKPKSQCEARRIIHHLDSGTMKTGNCSDKAEAEAITGSAATPLQPVKTLEDILVFIGGNSRPVVGNRNESAAIPSDLHGHTTGFTTMFDRVVDEVRHGIKQKVPIARDEYSLIQNGIEVRVLV